MPAAPEPTTEPGRLGELVRLFLKLGVIGFGGPAAHIALMRDEVVRRRRWLDDREFLDLVGATNLIPGPNSTELAIHLGQRRAGRNGLIVAGVCFIGPAVCIVAVLAWLYRRYGTEAAVVDLRYGVLPVIFAIVAHALYGLGRSALTSLFSAVLAVAAFAGYLGGVHELLLLVTAGAASALWTQRRSIGPVSWRGALPWLAAAWPEPIARRLAAQSSGAASDASPLRLFLVFLEIGSVLYGSGYVLLAFLQRHLVDRHGWITSQQLLDAVAVGQVTPGPVFSTATFVGWQIDGPVGAAVATVGIFLPSFFFVALLGRLVPWMTARPAARAFLTGVTLASLGLMAGVCVELAGTALVDPVTAALAAVTLAVLVGSRVNSAWLIGAGVIVGALHAVLG